MYVFHEHRSYLSRKCVIEALFLDNVNFSSSRSKLTVAAHLQTYHFLTGLVDNAGFELSPSLVMKESLFPRRIILNRKKLSTRYVPVLGVAFLFVWAWSLWPGHPRPFHQRPPPVILPHAVSHTTHAEWYRRSQKVKGAFLHAYSGYERHASPHDELRPMWNTSVDKYVILYCGVP